MRIIKSMQCLKVRPSGLKPRIPLSFRTSEPFEEVIGLMGNTLFDRMRDFGHFKGAFAAWTPRP